MKTIIQKTTTQIIKLILLASCAMSTTHIVASNEAQSPKPLKVSEIKARIPDALINEAIQCLDNGELHKFDPLCGDTSCQIRTIMVKKLFEKHTPANEEFTLNTNEKRLLALSLLLTKAKHVIEKDNKRSSEALNPKQLLQELSISEGMSQKQKIDLEIMLKKTVGEEAFGVFSKAIGAIEKKELGALKRLPNLTEHMSLNKMTMTPKLPAPFFIKEFVEKNKANNDITGIPCMLSLQAILSIAQDEKMPIALKTLEHIIVIPNNTTTTLDTPVLTIKGTTENEEELLQHAGSISAEGLHLVTDPKKLEKLEDCILANGIQHSQFGGQNSPDTRTIEQIITEKLKAKINKLNFAPEHTLNLIAKKHDEDSPFTSNDLSKILEINKTLPRKGRLSVFDVAFVERCASLLSKVEGLRPRIDAKLKRFCIEHIFITTGKHLLSNTNTQKTKVPQ